MKRMNNYANAVEGYDRTPKSVYAALALSFALRLCEDDFDRANALIAEEWGILHNGGIVPQPPRVKSEEIA